MKKEIIKSLTNTFESHSYMTENGIEFWYARDLQHLLGYTKWDNFVKVINKTKTSCEASGNNISDHFADVGKMVKIGSGTERQISAEHITNNRSVRKILIQRGIKPEKLPPEEDIKKLERRVKSESKKLGKNTDKLE
ncbi:MAG: hypothetical protein GXO79_07600 [Chlorobi bacterium]|nr:hypothetical protein [Chlorobiota bacterium]